MVNAAHLKTKALNSLQSPENGSFIFQHVPYSAAGLCILNYFSLWRLHWPHGNTKCHSSCSTLSKHSRDYYPKKKKSTSALSNCTQLWRSEITSEVTVVHTVTVLSICKVHVFFFFQSIVWDFQIYTFEHHNGQEAKTNAVLSGGVFGVVSAAYLNRNHLKTRRYIELRQGTYISYCHCRYTPTKPMKHKVTIDYFS